MWLSLSASDWASTVQHRKWSTIATIRSLPTLELETISLSSLHMVAVKHHRVLHYSVVYILWFFMILRPFWIFKTLKRVTDEVWLTKSSYLAGTQCWDNVVSMSMQRDDVASTLMRRCINDMCLQGIVWPGQIDTSAVFSFASEFIALKGHSFKSLLSGSVK